MEGHCKTDKLEVKEEITTLKNQNLTYKLHFPKCICVCFYNSFL